MLTDMQVTNPFGQSNPITCTSLLVNAGVLRHKFEKSCFYIHVAY